MQRKTTPSVTKVKVTRSIQVKAFRLKSSKLNMEQNEPLRIVLLGKTGAGKSSLANVICGEEGEFKESASANSETKECSAKDKRINGQLIRLIDTPGLFDTDLNTTDLSQDILRCIKECAPGPHAFLLVLKVERFTKQEQDVVDIILKQFSAEALNYTTVVFTHGDHLDEGMRIEDWVYENAALKTLVQKCGGRCHVFDNKYWKNSQDSYRNNQVQVMELLRTIEKTVEKNRKHYTNAFLEYVLNNMKMIRLSLRFTARVLVGALLGVFEEFKDLFENRPSSEEQTGLCQNVQETETLRIVLLGKIGAGKSSVGNTIFGDRNIFQVKRFTYSSRNHCQSFTKRVHGRNIQLIDTPGLIVTDPRSTELNPEILKCLTECAPGPHAFLLLFNLERFTQQEEEVVNIILKYFSEEILKFTTVVFTRGEDLPKGMRIEDWVKQNAALRSLVQKCGGRCHVFDNRYWNNRQDPYRNNQVQVRELLRTIEETVEKNGGRYYNNEMLQKKNNPRPRCLLS